MNDLIPFPVLLETFFTDRLMRQRQASPHTIASYRDGRSCLDQNPEAPANDDCGDAQLAEEGAYNYVAKYFECFAEHYEIFGEHLANSKSYAHYSGAGSTLKELGYEKMIQAFVASNVWGTPRPRLHSPRST